jgi:hypothetical protein
MTNIEIRVNTVEPFAEGQAFGEAGSYLRIRGVAKGELDPATPENRVIVDLDKAPRNARGLVEYETDFFILRPADPSRTNGVLVYDVTNRGSRTSDTSTRARAPASPAYGTLRYRWRITPPTRSFGARLEPRYIFGAGRLIDRSGFSSSSTIHRALRSTRQTTRGQFPKPGSAFRWDAAIASSGRAGTRAPLPSTTASARASRPL